MGAASVSPATPSRLKTGYSDLFPEGHFPLCPITASVSAALFRSPGTSETLKFTLAPWGPYPSAFTEAPGQTEAEPPLLWLPLRCVCTASHAEHLESTSVSLRAESAPLAVSLPQPWCPSSRQAKGEQSSLTVPGHPPPAPSITNPQHSPSKQLSDDPPSDTGCCLQGAGLQKALAGPSACSGQSHPTAL